jgi:hypothetical protein
MQDNANLEAIKLDSYVITALPAANVGIMVRKSKAADA